MPRVTKIRHMRTKIRHVACHVLYFQWGIPSIRSRNEFIFGDTFFLEVLVSEMGSWTCSEVDCADKPKFVLYLTR